MRADGIYLDRKKLNLTPQQIEFVRLVIEHPTSLAAAEIGARLRVGGNQKTAAKTVAHQTKEAVAAAIREALTRAPPSGETDDAQILKAHRGRGYEFLVESRILAGRPES